MQSTAAKEGKGKLHQLSFAAEKIKWYTTEITPHNLKLDGMQILGVRTISFIMYQNYCILQSFSVFVPKYSQILPFPQKAPQAVANLVIILA